MLDLIYEIFPLVLTSSVPLIITGLGGVFSERSGVVNIALDGCMQIGGFVSACLLVILFEMGVDNAIIYAVIAAVIAGGLFVSIHAFASIHMLADQTISGTALNVLAGGLTITLCEAIFGHKSTSSYSVAALFSRTSIPILCDIPIIGDLFFTNNYPFTYCAYILVVVAWFIMYKTSFGLRLRSCGEYPQASASMGINVQKMRWIAVVVSGMLAALGGASLVLTSQTYFYASSINGLGFVAIATLIFGRWHPLGVFGASIVFGFAKVLGYYTNSLPLLAGIPSQFFSMFPYVLTIIVLVIFSFGKNSSGPKASGEIYDPGKR